jgi:hypothetical protein
MGIENALPREMEGLPISLPDHVGESTSYLLARGDQDSGQGHRKFAITDGPALEYLTSAYIPSGAIK